MIGSKKWLKLQIQILNKGEDAFNALLEVKFPYLVSFIKADNMEPGRTLLCSAPKSLNNYTLQCEIGNPLGENSEITVRVFVQPFLERLEESEVSDITFAVRVKSSNPEAGNDNFDNEKIIAIPIRVETDIRITGKSEPTEMEYNVSAPLPTNYTKETEIGEIVSHIYNFRNKGPSPIVEAIVHIFWPSFNDKGNHLLYLLGLEYDHNKVMCEDIRNLDPMALTNASNVVAKNGDKWVWSETSQKWEWEAEAGAKQVRSRTYHCRNHFCVFSVGEQDGVWWHSPAGST